MTAYPLGSKAVLETLAEALIDESDREAYASRDGFRLGIEVAVGMLRKAAGMADEPTEEPRKVDLEMVRREFHEAMDRPRGIPQANEMARLGGHVEDLIAELEHLRAEMQRRTWTGLHAGLLAQRAELKLKTAKADALMEVAADYDDPQVVDDDNPEWDEFVHSLMLAKWRNGVAAYLRARANALVYPYAIASERPSDTRDDG